jgi:hypothetical protein
MHKKIWVGLLATTAIWSAVSFMVGALGLFDQPGEPPVFFGLFLGGSVAGFLLIYRLSKTIREALLAIPLWFIVAMHMLRFVGIFFIIDALNRMLAPQFGLPAGIGDIVAAITSIPIMIMLLRGNRSTSLRRGFIVWNIYGLIDLFSAVTLGLLYSQSVVGILSRPGLDSQALTHVPLSLIPTFYVPILILLHLLALRRYREL